MNLDDLQDLAVTCISGSANPQTGVWSIPGETIPDLKGPWSLPITRVPAANWIIRLRIRTRSARILQTEIFAYVHRDELIGSGPVLLEPVRNTRNRMSNQDTCCHTPEPEFLRCQPCKTRCRCKDIQGKYSRTSRRLASHQLH